MALAVTLLTILTACPRKPPPEQPERPVPGGTLRVSVGDLASLDPARATGRGSLTAVAAVFEPLVRFDAATGALVPGAALRWAAGAGGKTWRFRLGTSRFSDGTPVTAADVKFAMDRISRRAVRADAAFLLERVRGFREARVTGTARGLSGVVVRSPTLVEFRLDTAFHEFPYLLAHPALAPLPAARYSRLKRNRLPARPLGNGPYVAAAFESGVEARLTRNPRYAGPTPYLDGIVLRADRSVEEGWRSFTSGEADLAGIPDGTLDPNPSQTGGSGPLWATLYLGPNLALRKYKDVKVRRALSQALDRDAIVSGVYGGQHAPASSLVPPGVRGDRPPCASCAPDLAAARSVLKRARPSVRVDHLDDARSKRLGALVVAQLKRAGVRATSKAYRRSAYEELLRRGQQDLAQLGFPVDVASPDGPLAQQLLSRSANNQVGFADRTFDTLIAKARAAADAEARLALYARAEARALALMPLIPLVTFRNRSAISTNVRDLTLDGIGVFDARKVWLAEI